MVDTAQDALAGEHAAVYAYGVVGGVSDPVGPAAERARDGYDVHRERRAELEQVLLELDAEPVPAEPGYGLPGPITNSADATRLARQVEDRCATLYAAVVAASTGPLRTAATGWLSDAATRGLDWGAPAVAFPGVGQA